MGNNEKFDPGELPGNRSCVLNNEYEDTGINKGSSDAIKYAIENKGWDL